MDLAVIRMLECFGKIQDFVVAEDIKSEQAASGRMFKEWSFSKEWNVKVKKKEKQQEVYDQIEPKAEVGASQHSSRREMINSISNP